MEPIDIKSLSEIDRLIAEKCDDGNGLLEEEKGEISIFTKAQQDFKKAEQDSIGKGKLPEVTIKGITYYYNIIVNALVKKPEKIDDPIEEKPDALMVDNTNTMIAASTNLIDDVTTYQLLKRLKGVSNLEDMPPEKKEKMEEKIEYVKKIVSKYCDKYNICELAPIIADTLGNETGGYVFSKNVLQNPGSKYKGCMQVDYTNCQCIFSEGPSKYKDWHKKHFSQDDEQIEELRSKYKNARNLYSAIQKDIELGLEVGIIAFKAKLHEAGGSVEKAIALYCGSQYKFPYDRYPDAPKHFEIT